jgi:hypothetical protein
MQERVADAILREHWPCWRDASEDEVRGCDHWPAAMRMASAAIAVMVGAQT